MVVVRLFWSGSCVPRDIPCWIIGRADCAQSEGMSFLPTCFFSYWVDVMALGPA